MTLDARVAGSAGVTSCTGVQGHVDVVSERFPPLPSTAVSDHVDRVAGGAPNASHDTAGEAAAVTATVTEIDIDRMVAMTLTFDDGHTCRFDVERLRLACPCAGCRGMRDRGEAPWPRAGQSDEVWIEGAELVGAWGISLRWSDGHSTGIYAWDALRRWCDAGLEAGLVIDLPAASGPDPA